MSAVATFVLINIQKKGSSQVSLNYSFVEKVNYDLLSKFPTATLECKGRPTKYSTKINGIVSVSGLINIIGRFLSKALKLQVPVRFKWLWNGFETAELEILRKELWLNFILPKEQTIHGKFDSPWKSNSGLLFLNNLKAFWWMFF